MNYSIYDLVPHWPGRWASRLCSRAPARPARRQAASQVERRAGWEARRCGTAPRWHGRVRRVHGGALRWHSDWPTPRAPPSSRACRAAYMYHTGCGVRWFRVVQDDAGFSAPRAPTTWRWGTGERSEPTHEKAPPDASSGATLRPQPVGAIGRDFTTVRKAPRTARAERGAELNDGHPHHVASPTPSIARSHPSESMASNPLWHMSRSDLTDHLLYPISAATSDHGLAST